MFSTINHAGTIKEFSHEFGQAVAFEPLRKTPSLNIRYDIFIIRNIPFFIVNAPFFRQIECDFYQQQEFIKNHFYEVTFRAFQKNCPDIQLAWGDIIVKDGSVYYVAMVNGPVGLSINLGTGRQSEDHIGVIIGIKDGCLIDIVLQKGLFSIRNLEQAKEELMPALFHCFEECLIKEGGSFSLTQD
jgi:hypothetical protein